MLLLGIVLFLLKVFSVRFQYSGRRKISSKNLSGYPEYTKKTSLSPNAFYQIIAVLVVWFLFGRGINL